MFKNTIEKIVGGDNYLKLSSIRYLPRWSVYIIDILILIISLLVTTLIFKHLNVSPFGKIHFLLVCSFILLLNLIFMYVFKTYAGIIRHSTFIDIQKIIWSSTSTLVLLTIIKYFVYGFFKEKFVLVPYLLIYFLISFIILILFRLTVKQSFSFLKRVHRSTQKKRILVLGISDQPIAIATAILENPNLPYELVGFLTKRSDSKSASLLGRPIIVQQTLLKKTKESLAIDGVILVKEILSKEEIEEWINLFIEKDIQIYKVPNVQKLREDQNNTSIHNIKIEDLLNRKPISIENQEVNKRHFNKNILVTGGAGSIGSEIVRQVALFHPAQIVIIDQAETPLHDIELELRGLYPKINFEFILCDVSNKDRLEKIFEKFNFSMVYHAAAYKHVPIIEQNPQEGARVNIIGTKNAAELSSKYKVNRFVMISTDKAVNPTNVMGATKRAAELFVQSLQKKEENSTKFITTRFGNVLGSNGSVIPHFQKQIEKGGPVTITHPEITRYFMTIPEACELVLQAGTMGHGGEIYVFDMGEPVKIIDLAKKMIKLSGLETGLDIQIVVTGLRPGEKLYEELLSDDAKTLPTHHEKIMISKDPTITFLEISRYVDEISKACIHQSKDEVVSLLKMIVPEFKSNNSEFEKLDK